MSLRDHIDETKLVCCAQGTTLVEVAELMRARDVGMVLVVDESQRPQGVITDRDLALRGLAPGATYAEAVALAVMSAPVETATVDEELTSVVARMRSRGIRRFPIVDGEGRVIAVLSYGDLFRWITERLHQLALAVGPEAPKIAAEAA